MAHSEPFLRCRKCETVLASKPYSWPWRGYQHDDWEGWWAPTTISGCGHAGFNSASKGRAAGAFCCFAVGDCR